MKELRNSFLLLLAYIIGLLGIAQIQYVESNYLDFQEAFFVLFALAAVLGILLPSFFRPSMYFTLILWGLVYALVWGFHWRTMDEPPTTLILGLQFILLELSAGLSHFVGIHLDEVDYFLTGLSDYTYPNRVLNSPEAKERIQAEMMRSGRFNHPLSVLVVQMKRANGATGWAKIESLQRDLLKRFAVAKLGQVISNFTRQTDLIVRESNDRFLIVCPETDKTHSSILGERLCAAIQGEVDAEVVWGIASYPEESYSFEELVEIAVKRVGSVAISSLPEYKVEARDDSQG